MKAHLAAVFLLALHARGGAQEPRMSMEVFHAYGPMSGMARPTHDPQGWPLPEDAVNRRLRSALQERGLPFPPGATVRYNARERMIFVRNTPENLRLLREMIEPSAARVPTVEVDAVCWRFDAEQFAILPRDANGHADAEAVRTLIRDGQGRMETTGKIVAYLNVPAGSRGVFETAPRMALQPAGGRDDAANRSLILEKVDFGFRMTLLLMPDPEPGFVRLELQLEMSSTRGAEAKERRLASPGKPGPDGSERAPTIAPIRVARTLRLRYGETAVAAVLPDAVRAETVCVLVATRRLEADRPPSDESAGAEAVERPKGSQQ